METALYIAAMEGNIDFLSEVRDREIESGNWDNFLQSLTPQKNNIIHIASQFDQFDFLKCGFNFRFFTPLMISQRNAKGDTPIHVASKRGNKRIVEFLVEKSKKFVFREEVASSNNEIVEEDSIGDDEGKKWAWRVQNLEGNTPLHEALINGKVEVAKCLLEVDPRLASFSNYNGETPLHLAIRYNVDGDKETAIDTIEQLNKKHAGVSYKGCLIAEESISMISLLLQKHKAAVYTRDKDGLTPLLRAGLECHINAVGMILKECPESLEMCDPNGKTVLHLLKFPSYEVAKKCMKIPQLFVLKDQQDDMGNTPAHLAVMNCREIIIMEEQKKVLREDDDVHHYIGVIRALLQSSTNFSLKNKQGLSAAALLQKLINSDHFPNNNNNNIGKWLKPEEEMIKAMLRENKYMMLSASEEFVARNKDEGQKMEQLEAIWKATVDGDVHVLRQELKTIEMWLLDEVLKLGDVVCILLKAGNAKKISYEEIEILVKVILEKNPFLISQTNIHGDTLLHTMLQYGHGGDYQISDSLLDLIKRCYYNAAQQHSDDNNNHIDVGVTGGVYCPPWKVKNVEGNTTLHEALLHVPTPRIVTFLLQCDRTVAKCVNNQNETPLHVLCRTKGKHIAEEELKEVAEKIIEANMEATYNRDNTDGYTPLLRAAAEGKIEIVKQICRICGDSAQLRDHKGKTFWHVMNMPHLDTAIKDGIRKMFSRVEYKDIQDLAYAKDNAGKTPLQHAIESHKYNLTHVLQDLTKINIYSTLGKDGGFEMQYNLFILGTTRFILAQLGVPLWSQLMRTGGWKKSIFGVKEEQIQEYTNGFVIVVAVLLATIAFTAAFTVPGGFDQNTGDALLLNNNITCKCTLGGDHSSSSCIMGVHKICIIRIAYWLFMVSDIVTMCLSVTIIYSVLLGLQDIKTKKFAMIDFTITLLQPTLSATMVTFMMGVFASTFRSQPGLAAFTVATSSLCLLTFNGWVVQIPFKYGFLPIYLVFQVSWNWISSAWVRLR